MFLQMHFDIFKCYFFQKTGIPCISCGFTRAALSLKDGNIVESIGYNAGFIPFAATLFIVLLSVFIKSERLKKSVPIFVYSTLIILFLHWFVKLYNLF